MDPKIWNITASDEFLKTEGVNKVLRKRVVTYGSTCAVSLLDASPSTIEAKVDEFQVPYQWLMIYAHSHTLKSDSPVSSQAFPIMEKPCPLLTLKNAQISIAGIKPVPGAIPAAKVKIPAPATLFTRLKTDERIVAFPSSNESPPPLLIWSTTARLN
jgi:hypothetical protein